MKLRHIICDLWKKTSGSCQIVFFSQIVKLLIEKHADVNKKGRDSRGSGATALHLAVEGSHADIVQAFIDAHCNVDEVKIPLSL